uniref:Ig-like domain-containing protein n=1 Tax=Chrysemys picta bellii TaxID=8478 RepID=A0A8C3IUK5_CHRPI
FKPTLREPHAPEVEVLYSCTTNPGTVQLVCLISGFYPKALTVEWLVDGEHGLLHSHNHPDKKNSDGTFSTRSIASVSQSKWLEGKTYTCQVSHPGSSTTKQDHARKCEGDCPQDPAPPALTPTPSPLPSMIPAPPPHTSPPPPFTPNGAAPEETTFPSNIRVLLVPPSPAALYVAQSPMLTCLVFNLPNDSGLRVVWSHDKPGSIDYDALTLTNQSNGTFTASNSMPIFTRDWEAGESFTCKVEHSALPSPIVNSISKKPGRRSGPGIYLLRPHNEELSSSEDSVSLTCLVRGFFPEDISVQWMKNHKPNESLEYLTTPPIKDGDGDPNFFLYSKLKVSKASWNSGDIYTCMVIHEALQMKFTQRSVSKVSGK